MFFTKLPSVKTIAIAAILSLFTGLLCGSWYLGSQSGKKSVQSLWDKDKLAYSTQIEKLKSEYEVKENSYIQSLSNKEREYNIEKGKYEDYLAELARDHASRMLKSEQRAAVYKRKAEGSPIERDSLASYAASLDKSLEEGRGLEQEYRATVEQLERDKHILSTQIIELVKLYE